MRNVAVQKAVHKALYSIFGGAAVAALAFAGQVSAADQSQSAQQSSTGTAEAASSSTATGADVAATALKAVEVTGTRIKRTSVEQAQPIEVVTAAQIKQTGLTNIGDVLQALTSAGSSISTATGNWGNGGAATGGQTTLNLRNLGPQRTLVLVNGHRWVTQMNGTVDLNTIPASIIDHIEILQDGASAIYGSDAIAGVVNIITVKNFNGAEANAYTGVYHGDGHWDGLTKSASVTFGSTNGRFSYLVDAQYRSQGSVAAGNRSISNEPIHGTGDTRGTAATPQGSFKFIAPYSGSTSDPNNSPAASTGLTSAECPASNFGTPSAPKYMPLCYITPIPGTPGTSPSDFTRFAQSDFWNYTPAELLLTPNQSFDVYSSGSYSLRDNLTWTFEATADQRQSTMQSAPDPFGIGPASSVDIPANENFNPFDFNLSTTQAVGPGLLINYSRRLVENGYRLTSQTENIQHYRTGFNGFFDTGSSEWDWDAGYAFSKDSEVDQLYGLLDANRVAIQLSSPAGCAAQASLGCTPMNLFGGQTNPMTPAQLAYASYVNTFTYYRREQSFYADITNSDIGSLPGGPIGFAAGYQFVGNAAHFQPNSTAMQQNNPPAPTNGATGLSSVYAEMDFPFVANAPFAKLVDLDVASRRTQASLNGINSSYNTSSRAGLKWQPDSEWLLRGTWSQGFRAPNISELFAGRFGLGTKAVDPCSAYLTTGVPVQVQNACAAAGVPPSYLQSTSQLTSTEEGNPSLKPETSISKTVGFVYSPNAIPGFNANFDFYKIQLEGTIQPIGGQNILDGCYFSDIASDCSRITRYPSGVINVLDDSVANIGGTLTEGYDFGFTYALPATPVGQFNVALQSTYIREYNNFLPSGTGTVNVTKLAGIETGGIVLPLGIPRWKALASVGWSMGNWGAHWKVQYVGPMQEACSDYLDGTPDSLANMGVCTQPNFQSNPLSRNRLAATVYNDVNANYTFQPWNATFTLGVNNIFDKNPPSSVLAVINSYDPTNYRVPGRFLYGSVTVKF